MRQLLFPIVIVDMDFANNLIAIAFASPNDWWVSLWISKKIQYVVAVQYTLLDKKHQMNVDLWE